MFISECLQMQFLKIHFQLPSSAADNSLELCAIEILFIIIITAPRRISNVKKHTTFPLLLCLVDLLLDD